MKRSSYVMVKGRRAVVITCPVEVGTLTAAGWVTARRRRSVRELILCLSCKVEH